jgi:hypothetical protein
MPQTNVTYDLPYHNNIRDIGKMMLNRHWAAAGSAYAPTDMGYKNSNFFNDYSQEPKICEMIGGGSPYPQKFLLSGNSSAYPPISMSSGLAVSSGGSRLSGIDGAVGGYSFNDFIGDVAHVGKEVGPDLIRASMMAKGRKKGGVGLSDILKFAPFLGLGRKGGSEIGDQIASVFKTIAPFAPLLMGLGHPEPKSKMDIVNALKHIGARANHSLPKLAEVALRGGYDISDFGNDVAGVVSSLIGMGHPKTKGGKRKAKGGLSLSDVLESVKPALSQAVGVAKPIAKKALKELADKGIDALASKVGGGRAKRAEIVKKVMKERGVSMINASKIVKSEGLY